MHLEEEHSFLQIVHDLTINRDFELLSFNTTNGEAWLEKKIKNTSHVVRILHQGFDWKNHLKKDINSVMQRLKSLKKLLFGRKIEIHNVYLSTYSPADEWEALKKPIQIKNRKPTEMKVYYLDYQVFDEELARLYQNLSLEPCQFFTPDSEMEMEQNAEHLKGKLAVIHRERKDQTTSLFNYGKPFITYILIVANVLMFFLIENGGGSKSTETLIEYGAKYNPAIVDGEWWRIVSSMFLHIGLLHLFMNMLALFYLGTAVERIYGNTKFVFVYFLAGIFGGLASFAFNPQIAAGASGAIFGLFGALLFFGVNYKKVFFQTMGSGLLFVIVLNIILGFSVPQIDTGAHLGGLAGGFLASAIVHLPKKKHLLIQILSLLLFCGAVTGFVYYGQTSYVTHGNPQFQLQLAQKFIQEEKYDDAVEATTKGISNGKEFQAELLFYRAYALINLNNINPAIEDLEEVVGIKEDFAEAHYNLAILYAEKGQTEDAIKKAKKAHELKPGNKAFSELYQRLSNG